MALAESLARPTWADIVEEEDRLAAAEQKAPPSGQITLERPAEPTCLYAPAETRGPVPVGIFYASPCGTHCWIELFSEPPPAMGVPAELMEDLPGAARRVFENGDLVALLCEFCYGGRNLQREGEKTQRVFCDSCLIRLAASPQLACTCGRPRHLDPLGKASGRVCAECHQEGPRKGRPAGDPREGRSARRRRRRGARDH